MNNYKQKGDFITATAPAGGVTSGMAVLIGGLFGVATTTALQDEEFELATTGVYDLPKVAANTFAIGAPVYFNTSNGNLTSTASGNKLVGTATAVAAGGDATASVRLNGVYVA